MSRIPILGKFLLIMGMFGGFAVAVAAYATTGMSQVSAQYDAVVSQQSEAAIQVSLANRHLQSAREAIADLLISTSDEGNRIAVDALKAAHQAFRSALDQAARAAPEQQARLQELQSRGIALIDRDCAHTIELAAVATAPEAVLASQDVYAKECAPGIATFSIETDRLVASLSERVAQSNQVLGKTTRETIARTYELILCGLCLVLAGGFVAVRTGIVRPLLQISSAMLALAGGDLALVVTGVDRRDEIGGMARSVQVFKDAAIQQRRLEAEAAQERADFEARRQESARQAAADATRQQQFVVQCIAEGLDHLANGALDFRITTVFPIAYEALRTDFNRAMDALQETIRLVASKTDAIRGGTQEITQAAQDLAARTQLQAASVAEATGVINQVTATLATTASGAGRTREIVGAARQQVERLGSIVEGAVGAMEEISGSSDKIGQIIGVIDEIAFQTNLLALNAGVEAARAGESGRGFAVVASEVRSLAQRSAEAAKEIKVLIHTSGEQTGRGVRLVGQTGAALSQIVRCVTEADEAIGEIAGSMQSQAAGLQEINATVAQIDQVTAQNAAMVEESTAATQNLAQETQVLVELAGQFRVGR